MDTNTEETVPEIIKVRCMMQAYYRDQMRAKDSIILYFTEDMDKGVIKAGPDKGKPRPEMPKWAKIVSPDTPLTLRDGEEAEDVTTLAEMSRKGTPAQEKEAKKVKEDRKKLDADMVKFEKDKAEFEASKNPQGKMDSHKEPEDGEVYTNSAKTETVKLKKEWRGTTKNSKKK